MKKLKKLLQGIEGIQWRGGQNVEITGLSADSRALAPGHLFIARKGKVHDGGQHIAEAVAAGARCILTDVYDPFLGLLQVIHPDPGSLLAPLAARYYEDPSKELFVVGVTGTKGKTTSCYLMHHLLQGLHMPCALAGSIEAMCGGKRVVSQFTTHDVIFNQKFLKEAVISGAKSAVLEVSSHGLDQGRVDGIRFDVAVFTNLESDHLDYHRTREEYAAAKRRLFTSLLEGTAILNADSSWSVSMRGGKKSLLFGIDREADVRAQNLQFSKEGISFTVDGVRFISPLMGLFNAYNLLGAIALGLERGASLEEVRRILSTFSAVPGRLERISCPGSEGKDICVFVDHAHTEQALDGVLTALREAFRGRILLVFGAGGDRDPRRRPGLARAAERGSDLAILTNDNPRREDPEKIAQEVLAGFRFPKKVLVELDRKKAIEKAIDLAAPGDVVLIAGKGHEKQQIFAHRTVPFDDVLIAKEALQARGGSG